MRRVARVLAYLALLVDPLCHVLGIPHPEMTQTALGYISSDTV